MEPIISVKDLKKVFKKYEREEGLKSAFKSLVHRKFEEKRALSGISFDVKKGEILGLIGPNGAGKSTTIKALCGVLHPTSGEVKVLEFNPWKERETYVQNIGVVFGQKSQLWWDLPAIDSFYLMKYLYSIPESAFKRRMNHMIKLLKIEDAYKTPVRNLSLGERMKCEVISALLHNPKIVLLDEAAIGMDVVARNKLRQFIREINKKYETTFVITTHDMNEIEKLCERVVIINEGKLIFDGLLSEVKRKYTKHKLIDVKFSEKTHIRTPKKCKLLSRSKFEIRLEVPVKNKEVEGIIKYLLENYPISDMTISNPDIDEIISEIYENP